MATLSARDRKHLPPSTFALPGERKFPITDASHAANAKARASQQATAGNLSPAQKAQVDAKANRILGLSGGQGQSLMSTRMMSREEMRGGHHRGHRGR